MQLLIIFSLAIATTTVYFYFNRQLLQAKKQLRITSNQLNKLLSEKRKLKTFNNNISVRFVTPTSSMAITNSGALLFLAPSSSSPKLKTLSLKTEVKLLDSATINSSTWYYVSIPSESNVNCRGWINQNDFTLMYSSNDSNIKNKLSL